MTDGKYSRATQTGCGITITRDGDHVSFCVMQLDGTESNFAMTTEEAVDMHDMLSDALGPEWDGVIRNVK